MIEERTDLREGGWRFFREVDETFAESVSEENFVTRDGERVGGEAAIHALLFDVPHDDPQRLAEQVGHLVVQATSRSSGRVKVREAAVQVGGDEIVVTAVYDRDGAPWPRTVTAHRSGAVTIS